MPTNEKSEKKGKKPKSNLARQPMPAPLDRRPPPPRNKRQNPTTHLPATDRRKLAVAEFAARGMNATEIMVRLRDLRPPIVADRTLILEDIRQLTLEWRERSVREVSVWRAEQLAQIQAAEKACWDVGDLRGLATFIALEVKITGTAYADQTDRFWQKELILLIREGSLLPEQAIEELGLEISVELFQQAGRPLALPPASAQIVENKP